MDKTKEDELYRLILFCFVLLPDYLMNPDRLLADGGEHCFHKMDINRLTIVVNVVYG